MDSRSGGNVGADVDTLSFQPLFAQPPGNAQRGRQTTGKVAAACRILVATVFDLGCIIGMTGSGTILQVVIVPGAGVGIADDGSNGGATGEPIHNSRKDLRCVRLLPRRRVGIAAGCPAAKESGQGIHIHGKSSGNAVETGPDSCPVGLTEDR